MLKPLVAASLISLGFLWACSSSDDTPNDTTTTPTSDAGAPTKPTGDAGGTKEVVSEAGAANQAKACTTLPRNFNVAPKDYYLVYASEAEAVTSLRKYRTDTPWSDPGSDLQKRGQAYVDKIFAAYGKLYPNTVTDMPTPIVVINDDTSFNAFAYTLPVIPESTAASAKLRVPWIFTFNKGIFTPTITDNQLTMIAAHEMGHLFLRNGNSDFFSHVYYRETPDEQGKIFGEYEVNETDIHDLLVGVQIFGGKVGQVGLPELHGVPTALGSTLFSGSTNPAPVYYRMILALLKKFSPTSPSPAKCTEGATAIDEVEDLIRTHKTADEEIVMGTDLPKLDAAATKVAALADCLSHVKYTYRDLAIDLKRVEIPNFDALTSGFTDAQMNQVIQLIQAEADADTADPKQNIVTKLLALGTLLQKDLAEVYVDPTLKYEQLREFTQEDDADEAAVRTAKIMGLDADDLAGGLLGNDDATYASSCRTLLAAGNVPKYGGAVDPHHGDCWRAYRNTKLKTALMSCPADWPNNK